MINPSEVMDSGGGGGPPTKKAKMVNGTTSNTTAQLTTQMSETSAEVSLNLESLLPDELVSSNDTPTNAGGGGQQAQGYYNNRAVGANNNAQQAANNNQKPPQKLAPSLTPMNTTFHNVANVNINNINIMVQPPNAAAGGQHVAPNTAAAAANAQRYQSPNPQQTVQNSNQQMNPMMMNVAGGVNNQINRINRASQPSQPNQINSNGYGIKFII